MTIGADTTSGIPFLKGHGTENDFVVLPDADGTLDLTPGRVAALCDRRRGLGADGVLRVVRWAALQVGPMPAEGVEWFMDYRNADGSIAEMCGNGVRVYARYLAHAGWRAGGELRANGKIEVEYQVDSNVNGQVWAWTLKDNGVKVAGGNATTVAPSGSFTVKRNITNKAGADKIAGSAVRGTVTCNGSLTF